MKSEMAISGNTVHVVWAGYKSNGHVKPEGYGVWYRRSTDRGATWEDAHSLYQRRTDTWYGQSNIMVVDGNNIHMVAPDNITSENENNTNSMLAYLHSSDGGENFTTLILDTLVQSYYSIDASVIRAEGSNVIVASKEYRYSYNALVIYRSTDGGASFTRKDVELPNSVTVLGDLQIKGDKWAVLWSYSWTWEAAVYLTTGDMNSDNTSTTVISPQIDDRHYGWLNKMSGLNGSDYNFHPLMAITGEQTIHVLFTGLRAKDEEEGDPYRTMYVRSDDFGQTWGEIKKLDETRDQHGTLVAKGQNVYAVVGTGYNRWIAYSNDNGDTWHRNIDMCYGSTSGFNYDSPNAYEIVLDPNDPTGAHAWYLGSRWLDIETKDGFNSISRALRADGSIGGVSDNRGSQFSPLIAIDGQGIRHMVMRQMVDYNTYGYHNVPQLFYRKEDGEPEPNGKTMALHMHRSDEDSSLKHRIVIPLAESLKLDSAMSIGFWMRGDYFGSSGSLVSLHGNISTLGENQDYSIYYPGFFIATTNPYDTKRMCIQAGITTDKAVDGKGIFLENESYSNQYSYYFRHPGVWHSVVLTFDARKTENNAHLYVDGYNVCTKTIPGALVVKGSNPIVIGNGINYNHDWYMDEFRMWNRALSEDEAYSLARHLPVSNEGCLVYYDFDGTLKDLSGHGNDAIAQLDCEFEEYEGLKLPEPKMQIAKDITGRKITFTDQTENGEAYWWFYNDQRSYYIGAGDTLRHPQWTYLPGEYKPQLIARGENACSSVKGNFRVDGLYKVEPAKAGRSVSTKVKIYGGYDWYSSLNVRLHKEGQEDVIGKWVSQEGYSNNAPQIDKLPYARFNLKQAETGVWDVIVGSDTLKQSFTVEEYEEPEVWASLNGWNKMLNNRTKDFYIEYGNRANADAYNVPLFLFVSDYADVTLGFENPMFTDAMSDEIKTALQENVGEYRVIDTEEYGSLRCYSFIIPIIPANSKNSQAFYLKSSKDVDMFYLISEPWGMYELDSNGNAVLVSEDNNNGNNAPRTRRGDELDDIIDGGGGGYGGFGSAGFGSGSASCMIGYLGWGVMDAAMGALPFAGCAWGIGKTVYQGFADKPQDRLGNLFTNTLGTAFSCAMDFNPLGWGMRATTLASFAFNTAMNIKSVKDCPGGDGGGKKIKAVGSYDPNEMIGPNGYGSQNYIKQAPEMNYDITFENKSTATAPAHEVFVTDTLDSQVYDLSSFAFTRFGWADTIVKVEGQMMKEFVQDIDLRPKQELIVRVSGKFNQENGVAQWSFISINPTTKQYEEDPDNGFLVPNNSNHDGEGFVNFSINHKDYLPNNQSIATEAEIVFDANEAIKTNLYVNTLDIDLPQSQATGVALVKDSLVVAYTAEDASSGIRKVNIYVSVNNEAFTLLKGNKVLYEPDNTYCFATIAIDNVGWLEDKDEAQLQCEATYVPTSIEDVEYERQSAVRKVFIDGHFYILKNGKTYTILGAEVK